MQDSVHASIPKRVLAQFHTYKGWQLYWYSIHYTAGVLAVIAGGLATAAGAKSGSEFIQTYIWVWGLAGSLFSGVVTFLGPLQKAESYKHAYYRLRLAITRFEEGLIDTKALLDESEKAQNTVLIGDTTAIPKAGGSV